MEGISFYTIQSRKCREKIQRHLIPNLPHLIYVNVGGKRWARKKVKNQKATSDRRFKLGKIERGKKRKEKEMEHL